VNGFPDLGKTIAARVTATVVAVVAHLAEMRDIELDPEDALGWAGWLIQDLTTGTWFDGLDGDGLSDEARRLLELVGPHVDLDSQLPGLLNQLEPLGRDLAAQESGGVRLMNMAASKGLTVNTTIVLGVEESMVPMPPPKGDLDEERRLLYVAVTRATDMCVLTSARRRTGPLARSGNGSTHDLRGRCPLLTDLSYGQPVDGPTFVGSLSKS
jgi:superfamily I DNA/RNA helicase